MKARISIPDSTLPDTIRLARADTKREAVVTVDGSEHGLVVKPVNRRRKSPIYTESELLAGLTPETVHADELARLTEREFGD